MDPSANSEMNGEIIEIKEVTNEEVIEIKEEKKEFKQFDIVEDYSDQYFTKSNLSGKKGHSFIHDTGTVRKKIMREWKILEENLPGSIYVRVYEGRIDLLRATIIGAAGTPYHDGLFFFDFLFPPDYPVQPPSVHYHSFGLRINPNLYADGTVCLSLLNTWPGRKHERWNPSESTILQVLLSIQALVLNEKPYFNEPGYGIVPGIDWDKKSLTYSQNIFALSCKIMLYVLRRPPRHFEDLVAAHFRERAHLILMASKAYMDGLANIGCLVRNGSLSSSAAATVTKSKKFKMVMDRLYPELVKAFAKTGASVGIFVEQVRKDIEETQSRPHTVKKKKEGFTRKIFNKVKKILGLSKDTNSTTSSATHKRTP
ncbi:putative ubiquitin-conjugating enzyme E2 38 [Telopea speciosissima]|uniref:putative ubiquitin-conjugating enzyme E2 38 n=1 Tax=Telopea speciosissima TaxID=54955 RepID=UPI001CC36C29|nr:putative ubiquitin-conjugating enzyme E2 38 [Telopea speciosissima]